jgi:dihydroxy-acid dehydratase
VSARTLDLIIDQAKFDARLRAFKSSGSLAGLRGYERLNQEHVLQADRGADFDFLTGESN